MDTLLCIWKYATLLFQTAYIREECNIYWVQSEKERTGYWSAARLKLRALYYCGKAAGTHWMGSWEGPSAGLDTLLFLL